ncbi:hypothetical protein CBR_g53713 [Chara braunii]|uniref:RanBP2-type domain-containing protein n=1 Tax=Chara braunii TaxID=69332 RepID=A0A388MBH7_CHABU|nr:hypothetical protein CBR_g53713 [Chara braunii]|eukprot:GBG91822.1 hypothetical protein CBR_g53713 [Chara braunii]
MYDNQDYRGPAVNKRPRLAEPPPTSRGAPGPGDWTCPSCGNMNFAFRTTCNMRKCGAVKPADNVMRPPQPPMYDPTQPVYVGGPGGAPPMPSYGSQIGPTPLMFYDQGPPMGGYNPQPSGIMGPGIGGPGYGPPAVDYNLGRPPPPEYVQNPSDGIGYYGMSMAPRGPPVFPQEDISRKRRGGPNGFSEGDWVCKECGNTNFAFRTTCNMRKCGAAKPDIAAALAAAKPGSRQPEPTPPDGSWTCKSCGNVNYPFRTKCNRRNCGAERPGDKSSSGASKQDGGSAEDGKTNGK